jgi:hypothetical protein
MLELLKMLVLIAAGAVAIKLLTRTMTPNRPRNTPEDPFADQPADEDEDA